MIDIDNHIMNILNIVISIFISILRIIINGNRFDTFYHYY